MCAQRMLVERDAGGGTAGGQRAFSDGHREHLNGCGLRSDVKTPLVGWATVLDGPIHQGVMRTHARTHARTCLHGVSVIVCDQVGRPLVRQEVVACHKRIVLWRSMEASLIQCRVLAKRFRGEESGTHVRACYC